MKKKMLSAFLCAAMAVTLVAGCGAPAADAGKDKGGDSKKEASEGIPKDEIKVVERGPLTSEPLAEYIR